MIDEIKELKFTETTLRMHLENPLYKIQDQIFTIRDTDKGYPGQVFHVAGVGYFLLTEVREVFDDDYILEGFGSYGAMVAALTTFYGHFDKGHFRMHVLVKVKDEA